jgi:hypothetical protein
MVGWMAEQQTPVLRNIEVCRHFILSFVFMIIDRNPTFDILFLWSKLIFRLERPIFWPAKGWIFESIKGIHNVSHISIAKSLPGRSFFINYCFLYILFLNITNHEGTGAYLSALCRILGLIFGTNAIG